MLIFLLFNIDDRMKFICIFSVRICSFAIFKAFLTHFFDNECLLYQTPRQTTSELELCTILADFCK